MSSQNRAAQASSNSSDHLESSPNLAVDPDTTGSASLDLEDIIDLYDESRGFGSGIGSTVGAEVRGGRKSLSASQSTLSAAAARQLSQTYFTATSSSNHTNNIPTKDDTASFYSALQDGFSLTDYEIARDDTFQVQDFLWPRKEPGERDAMLSSPQNFQVYWDDIAFKIEPKISLSYILDTLEESIYDNVRRAYILATCSRNRSQSYSIDGNSSQKSSSDNGYNPRLPKTILRNLCGSFKSGELTAVIGPSGAGKTSLLNFLSRRREDGYSGQLYVENCNRKIKISTIPQDDALPEYLTVRENLLFASRLTNPRANYSHNTSVERVCDLLGLTECLDTRTKKISGGQHKRVAIAQELLSKPDVLILDEPTSGLDSSTCLKTLSVLRDLVKSSAKRVINPIAILLTIHQPEQEVFCLFDKIYAVAKGGRVIYDGPPMGCTAFIQRCAGITMPDDDYNPASFLIDVASGVHGDEAIEALERQVKLEFRQGPTHQLESELFESLESHTGKSHAMSQSLDAITRKGGKKIKSNTTKTTLSIDSQIAKGSAKSQECFFYKTLVLLRRCWLLFVRDPKQLITRFFFHLSFPMFLAFIMGSEPGQSNACPTYQAEYNLTSVISDPSITSNERQENLLLTLENSGVIFILLYTLTFAGIGAVVLSFTLDMQRSMKEYYNGWYSMNSYLLARTLADLPIETILPSMSVVLCYIFTNQMQQSEVSNVLRISMSALAIVLGTMIGQTIGMMVGAMYVGHLTAALFVSQGATLPLVFVSGFVVRLKEMSKPIYMLTYISFYRYCFPILLIARYGYNICNCDPSQDLTKEPRIVGVPEQLVQFTNFWSAQADEESPTSSIAPLVNDTSTVSVDDSNTTKDSELFNMFAKQISRYQTNGADVKSCDDVVPYLLRDFELKDDDVMINFVALALSLLVAKVVLIIVVKLVMRFKTSL